MHMIIYAHIHISVYSCHDLLHHHMATAITCHHDHDHHHHVVTAINRHYDHHHDHHDHDDLSAKVHVYGGSLDSGVSKVLHRIPQPGVVDPSQA